LRVTDVKRHVTSSLFIDMGPRRIGLLQLLAGKSQAPTMDWAAEAGRAHARIERAVITARFNMEFSFVTQVHPVMVVVTPSTGFANVRKW
jgi:hypothetical protein